MSQEQQGELICQWQKKGYETVGLGTRFSLEECAKVLSNSWAFVGAASGMASLGYAVGVPVFLIRNGFCLDYLMQIRHGHFVIVEDYDEFQETFPQYLSHGMDYYRQIACNADLLNHPIQTS